MDPASLADRIREHSLGHKVFFSYHHKLDCWRASQIRNGAAVEGNSPASDSEWDTITKGGDIAIDRWISAQLSGRSCAVVLIGPATAGRIWINHEIKKAWNENKGVVGIYIHNLNDRLGNQSAKGANPFNRISIASGAQKLSNMVKAYDPPYTTSPDVYKYITSYIDEWVEEAIAIRHAAPSEGRYQPAIRNV